MNAYKDLSSLRPGQRAAVQALSASGPMRRRLQDIGLIQGTVVECLGASPLGDPAAYLIRGAVIALRGQDAAGVLIGPATAAEGSWAPSPRRNSTTCMQLHS